MHPARSAVSSDLWSGKSIGSNESASLPKEAGSSSGYALSIAALTLLKMSAPPAELGCSPSENISLQFGCCRKSAHKSTTGTPSIAPTLRQHAAYSFAASSVRLDSACAGRSCSACSSENHAPSSTGGGVRRKTRALPSPHARIDLMICLKLSQYSLCGTCCRESCGGQPRSGGGRHASFAPRQTVTRAGAAREGGKSAGRRWSAQREVYPE
mmetsp:Transcript_25321/g.61224  ORF Transcript_25321/g.61224 Transcript_25321/m.61224 type:complete len:212 (-) Transcript_25321:203-838(-)